MAVLLKCPDCEGKFRWTFNATSQWPDHCPLCGKFMGMTEEQELTIPMPFLRSSKTKANDAVARAIMDGSERRAEIAAEQAGCSVAEMSALKITNLNDRKDSQVAAMPVRNDVTAHMEMMNQRGAQFGFAGSNAVEYSGAVQTGPAPNAGAKMRTALQQHHTTISRGAAVSDRPAMETTQPGYRRRG